MQGVGEFRLPGVSAQVMRVKGGSLLRGCGHGVMVLAAAIRRFARSAAAADPPGYRPARPAVWCGVPPGLRVGPCSLARQPPLIEGAFVNPSKARADAVSILPDIVREDGDGQEPGEPTVDGIPGLDPVDVHV